VIFCPNPINGKLLLYLRYKQEATSQELQNLGDFCIILLRNW